MDSLVNIIIYGFGMIFSLGLFIVSSISYKKSKNKKILFVSIVLFVFSIKFILLSISIFNTRLEDILSVSALGVFDLILLVLLFVAILTRS